MRKFVNKLRRESVRRPFTSAVIVVLVIVIPGFIRLEQITDAANSAATEAHAVAEQVARSEARELAEEDEEDLLSCQTRNTFQKNTREKFYSFINAVEVAFVSQSDNPQRADAIRIFTRQLRDSISTSPEDEDRDCTDDGLFDDRDYLP